MQRNVKKEVIIVDGVEHSFIAFAQRCYKNSNKKQDFEWYVNSNKKSLTTAWDMIKQQAKTSYVANIEKEIAKKQSFFETIKTLIKSMF